jgi:uncharacterized protein (DUF427 family)
VTLTSGRGPLSADPAGRFVPPIPAGVVFVEPFPKRVRAVHHGETVIDSDAVLLVHRAGHPPAYALPAAAVVGVPVTPVPEAPGHVEVAWDAVDAWFEEEEEVFLHARNPYHRVDCVRSRRRLRVEVEGATVVDADDTMGVFETALPTRLYVDREHIRMDLLVPSPTTTYCPYKGTASYWSAVVDGRTVEDVAWSYDDPVPESISIGRMLCFDPQRAAVFHDGERT